MKGRLNTCSRKSDRYVSIWTGISAISPLEIFRGVESPPLRAGISALGVWKKSSAQNFRLSSVHLQRLYITRLSLACKGEICSGQRLRPGGPEYPPFKQEPKFRPKSPGKFRPTPAAVQVWRTWVGAESPVWNHQEWPESPLHMEHIGSSPKFR